MRYTFTRAINRLEPFGAVGVMLDNGRTYWIDRYPDHYTISNNDSNYVAKLTESSEVIKYFESFNIVDIEELEDV